MKPKEVILKAFEGGKADRLPVTLFGAGMWSIKRHGTIVRGPVAGREQDDRHACRHERDA